MTIDQIFLFEQGNLQQDLEGKSSTIYIEKEESEKEYWEKRGEEIGKVGLINYPVPAKEILRNLKKIGVYIKPYSKMSEAEAKIYLNQDVRPFIRCQLSKYNLSYLRRINQMNRQEYNQYSRVKTERR